jgi:hypothetical protein
MSVLACKADQLWLSQLLTSQCPPFFFGASCAYDYRRAVEYLPKEATFFTQHNMECDREFSRYLADYLMAAIQGSGERREWVLLGADATLGKAIHGGALTVVQVLIEKKGRARTNLLLQTHPTWKWDKGIPECDGDLPDGKRKGLQCLFDPEYKRRYLPQQNVTSTIPGAEEQNSEVKVAEDTRTNSRAADTATTNPEHRAEHSEYQKLAGLLAGKIVHESEWLASSTAMVLLTGLVHVMYFGREQV